MCVSQVPTVSQTSFQSFLIICERGVGQVIITGIGTEFRYMHEQMASRQAIPQDWRRYLLYTQKVLTQQVLRIFFPNFGLIFQYVSPLDPWI